MLGVVVQLMAKAALMAYLYYSIETLKNAQYDTYIYIYTYPYGSFRKQWSLI